MQERRGARPLRAARRDRAPPLPLPRAATASRWPEATSRYQASGPRDSPAAYPAAPLRCRCASATPTTGISDSTALRRPPCGRSPRLTLHGQQRRPSRHTAPAMRCRVGASSCYRSPVSSAARASTCASVSSLEVRLRWATGRDGTARPRAAPRPRPPRRAYRARRPWRTNTRPWATPAPSADLIGNRLVIAPPKPGIAATRLVIRPTRRTHQFVRLVRIHVLPRPPCPGARWSRRAGPRSRFRNVQPAPASGIARRIGLLATRPRLEARTGRRRSGRPRAVGWRARRGRSNDRHLRVGDRPLVLVVAFRSRRALTGRRAHRPSPARPPTRPADQHLAQRQQPGEQAAEHQQQPTATSPAGSRRRRAR